MRTRCQIEGCGCTPLKVAHSEGNKNLRNFETNAKLMQRCEEPSNKCLNKIIKINTLSLFINALYEMLFFLSTVALANT